MDVFAERRAGILLHPTSLPGTVGNGDLGKEAIILSISWPTAVYVYGRRSRLAQLTKIAHPISVCRFTPATTA